MGAGAGQLCTREPDGLAGQTIRGSHAKLSQRGRLAIAGRYARSTAINMKLLRLLPATNKRHRDEVKDLRTAMSQIGGPTSGAPPLQQHAISLPVPLPREPSPPPLPTPAPVGPPGRQVVAKPSAIPRSSRHRHEPSGSGARPRRSSLVNRDRDRTTDTAVIIPAGPPLPAGSSHTRNKSMSVLSRPSVRIEVHEYVQLLCSLSKHCTDP